MLDGDLAKAPIWDDLTTFDGGPWRGRVDLVSAGFPCQPFSQAGLELTTSDPRYLWDDVARVIGEAGPRIVFLENVPRLLTARFVPGDDSTRGGVFGRVLADLAALGYVGAWRTLRAADVGAPHRRERVFILAVAPDAVDWSRDKHGRSKRTNGQTATWHRTDGERGSLANPDRERRQGQGLATESTPSHWKRLCPASGRRCVHLTRRGTPMTSKQIRRRFAVRLQRAIDRDGRSLDEIGAVAFPERSRRAAGMIVRRLLGRERGGLGPELIDVEATVRVCRVVGVDLIDLLK